MKESEYISATNRVKVTMALSILRDVVPGADYGVTTKELTEVSTKLSIVEQKLFSSYNCEEDE